MGQTYNYSDLKNPIDSTQGGAFPFVVAPPTSSYTLSNVFESGATNGTDFYINAVTPVGSGITAITFKLEISYDSTNWAAAQTTRQDTNTTAAEHTWTIGAAPQNKTLYINTQNTRGVFFCRIGVHGDAVEVLSTNSVTVNATTF